MELHVKNSTEALANYSDGRLGDETKRQEANAAHTMTDVHKLDQRKPVRTISHGKEIGSL
jgi:hypothetical protein